MKLLFAPTASSQVAGAAFAARLGQRKDREPISGTDVAKAQIAAFRAWEGFTGVRFAKLRKINHPCLVVSGVFHISIPVRNSYLLSEHLPNAVLLTYPDSGQAAAFLAADSQFAPY